MTLSEIFELDRVNIHNKYDVIFKTLIKRNADKNLVISEEAEKSLTTLCITCNCNKALVVLVDILKGNTTNDLITTIINIFSKLINYQKDLIIKSSSINKIMNLVSEQLNKNKSFAPIRNAIKAFFIALEYYFSK